MSARNSTKETLVVDDDQVMILILNITQHIEIGATAEKLLKTLLQVLS